MSDPVLDDERHQPALPAGEFSSWLAHVQSAIRGEAGSEVPCGGCTACCTSSQFIHIGPDETETLAHIPRALLSPAPRLPSGHFVLGYDDTGRCPMLVDDRCSIYEHRPRTCRTYDCRVFAATRVDPGPGQERIAQRTGRWRFDFPTEADRTSRQAVRAATAFVERHPEVLPDKGALTPTRLAAAALTISGAFLDAGGRVVEPDPEQVRLQLRATRLA
jgi:hypothetical protein